MTDQPRPLTYAQIRAYIENCGGARKFSQRHGTSWRMAERLYMGAIQCPPGLADEIRAFMEAGA